MNVDIGDYRVFNGTPYKYVFLKPRKTIKHVRRRGVTRQPRSYDFGRGARSPCTCRGILVRVFIRKRLFGRVDNRRKSRSVVAVSSAANFRQNANRSCRPEVVTRFGEKYYTR